MTKLMSFPATDSQCSRRHAALRQLMAQRERQQRSGTSAVWTDEQSAVLASLVELDTPWQDIVSQMGCINTGCAIMHWWGLEKLQPKEE